MDEGTRGLSLFICLSEKPDGLRNAVSVASIEEKMRLHASPTCQLIFDGAIGEIVGRPGDGLKAMFTMMNHARIDVALQGVAHSARAADIARAYAEVRKQGRDAATGQPVTIDQHADVARMLDEQEALAIGGRALCHLTSIFLEAGDQADLVDFLTPVCKFFCTEAGMTAANLGIQILGGYGYLHEYRVEQTWCDVRIAVVYEGTTGIHALTIASRMLRNKVGAAAEAFAGFVRYTMDAAADSTALKAAFDHWSEVRALVLAASDPGTMAYAFMKLTSLVAYMAAWERVTVKASLAADPERLERLAAKVRRTGVVKSRYWFDLHQV